MRDLCKDIHSYVNTTQYCVVMYVHNICMTKNLKPSLSYLPASLQQLC